MMVSQFARMCDIIGQAIRTCVTEPLLFYRKGNVLGALALPSPGDSVESQPLMFAQYLRFNKTTRNVKNTLN